MPISFESGDIFATEGVHGFAHGCNCAGAMGKGIAIFFRERWPAMYKEYRRQCQRDQFQLGEVICWEERDDVIFNLGTQKSWRTSAELWAVEKSLAKMVHLAEQKKVMEIVMPRIGAGLGGLNWNDVRPVLQMLGEQTTVRLRVCDIFIAGKSLSAGV